MDWREELKLSFRDRIRFDKVERSLYGHDVGTMPDMISKMFKTLPDAVVQPVNVAELKLLLETSRRYKIPIVPRGAGTSGYGGALPTKGGIVVELTRMKNILNIDKEQMTVTVEPGIIWAKLEKELNEKGLKLRLYPSSAPGSTVGGWTAENGAGIGSYQYGYFHENLVEVELLTPDGTLRTMNGDQLKYITALEGITGFITKITFKIQPYYEDVPYLIQFPSIKSLADFLSKVTNSSLPIWHLSFSSPEFIKQKEKAVTGKSEEEYPPQALIVFEKEPEDNYRAIEPMFLSLGGKLMSQKEALHEWGERFYTMRLKRLGPSLIPSEAIVPISSIFEVLLETSEKIKGLAIEGVVVNKNEATLLAFLTGDQRRFAYAIGYTKSLEVADIAKNHDGRIYTAGLYFTDESEKLFGKERLQAIKKMKEEIDPEGLLNPNKVLPPGAGNLLRTAMKTGKVAKPLTKLMEGILPHEGKESPKLPPHIGFEAYACAQCGYCRDVCTLYEGRQWESSSPRGKFYFLRQLMEGKLDFDQQMVDTFLLCTTCKKCDDVCQVQIPIQHLWDDMRGFLIQEKKFATFPAFEMMGQAVASELNIWAGRKQERDAWMPEDVEYKNEGEIGFWAGCTASFVEADIAENAVHILKEGGVEFAYLGKDENCCGTPFLTAGKWDTFEQIFRHNVEQINKRGIKTLVVSCPGCWVSLEHFYKDWAKKLGLTWDVKIEHISETTSRLIEEGKLNFKQEVNKTLTWHDPCHIGRHGGIYEPPRHVISSIPGVTYVDMESNRENGRCCGSVLTRIGDPKVSDKIAYLRLKEAEDVKADEVLTTCPCCEFQLRVGGRNTGATVPVKDFTSVVAEALGYEPKDPTNYVYEMWDVFDQAIEQLALDGMVAMFEELMPQMFDIMPDNMQKGMSTMKKMPKSLQTAGLSMMEKMIPSMMPKMLDDMLPQMMPQILLLMGQKIPNMPDSMKELMPKMMPGVMEKILPHALPDILERIKPRMMELMKERLES